MDGIAVPIEEDEEEMLPGYLLEVRFPPPPPPSPLLLYLAGGQFLSGKGRVC